MGSRARSIALAAAFLVSTTALSVLTVTAIPGIAHADPSKEDIASAKAALTEGRALREKGGDLSVALTKFRAAYALVPTPITGYELGRTEEMSGLLLEARDTLLEVVNMPVSPKEVDEHKAARANAADLAQKIKPRIPSLTVELKGNVVLDGKDASRVTIDGHDVSMAALGAARKLDPGKHTVRASTGVSEKVEEVTLKEGESRSVTVVIPGESPAVVSGDARAVAPAAPIEHHSTAGSTADKPAASSSGSSQKTIGIVVGGAGLVAIGVGSVLGLSAKSRYNESAPFCHGNLCQADGVSIRDDARSKAAVATIAIGVGAAALVTGVVLLVTAPSSDGTGRVEVGIAPGMVSVMGRF